MIVRQQPPPHPRCCLHPKDTNPTANFKLQRHQAAVVRASAIGNGIKTQLYLPSLSSSDSASLDSIRFTASVGSAAYADKLFQRNLGSEHIRVLSVAACAVAISTSWLFFSAIPTLLSFKRAAESMAKLMDATSEELPDTMAAVRLSGMEISDLTMEISEIGQEITQGVRSSTRAVRVVEDRLRRLTAMAPALPVQGQAEAPTGDKAEAPAVARAARNLREGILKGRSVLGAVFSIAQFSRWALNFLAGWRRSV